MLCTRDDASNLASCLSGLARQRDRDFEVVVVDAQSSDATLDVLQRAQRTFPVPLRIETTRHDSPLGVARNRGVALSRAPRVAFLSPGAEPDEYWTREALRSLERHDLVYGRQIHEPARWGVGAAVRGLRHQFPDGLTTEPLRYASNACSAYRREVLNASPFGWASESAEDQRLARRAHREGRVATYNPHMVVRQRATRSARRELHERIADGAGWNRCRDGLGLCVPLLGWSVALAAAIVLAWTYPGPLTFALAAATLWAPTVRRALRRQHGLRPAPLAAALLASPLFDLAFLAGYLASLLGRTPPRLRVGYPKEAQA